MSVDNAEMSRRFDVREEITARLENEYRGIFEKFELQIEQLNVEIQNNNKYKVRLDEKELELSDTKKTLLTSQRETGEALGAKQSLEHQLTKVRGELSTIKQELNELKKLNPKTLKSRLEKEKKKIVQKDEAIGYVQDRLTKKTEENTVLSQAIGVIKQKLDRLQQGGGSSIETDYIIYSSKCGNFKIFGAEFCSESHPFVGDNINYRVLDIRDGSSVVAQWINDEIQFSKPNPIPNEVKEALITNILISQDVTE